MGVDFSKTFGASSDQSSTTSNSSDRSAQPKAKIWLNIGYVVENVPTSDGSGTESRFVSLPVGIPLDTMEKLPTNSRNQLYAQFQAARNDLFDQLMAVASELQPGEDRIFGVENGLAIQIRHVAAERENITVGADNPFAMKLVG